MLAFIKQFRAPAPSAPDGNYDKDAANSTNGKTGTLLSDFLSEAKSGHLGADAATVLQGLSTISSGEPLDDRKLLLEHGVSMLQRLPANSKAGNNAANAFIELLWHDLPHPPAMLVGEGNRFRSADGSGNNPLMPEMGKVGTPYSRSVPPRQPKPVSLPDPGLIYDLLLRRNEYKPHPSGLSSCFVSFATVVIHEIFCSNRADPNINDTSSYVDLSTLYGNNQGEQDAVRNKTGRGLLHPDTIASDRLFMMPPGVVILVILFSRHHNYIAGKLLEINEAGWYVQDEQAMLSMDPAKLKKQDEELFQLARNINVAMFAQVVLHDYVSAILNTPRAGSEWALDLAAEIKKENTRVPRSGGNIISCEFQTLYKWHSAISMKDAKWMEEVFRPHFGPDRDLSTLTPAEFMGVAKGTAHKLATTPNRLWETPHLKRGPTGAFNDDDVARIFLEAIEEPACAFGANGHPAVLKVVDILGIKQARDVWHLCTLNEFREYLNLKPHASFLEWNSDPVVARNAELLYGHIDNLELYPGLLAEEAKPAMPGSGVCPPQTIGRGILSDAVSLVRSDRFLAHNYDVSTLTSWGMSYLAKAQPGSYGGHLGLVLYATMPQSFDANSTYSMLPFYTPEATREILTSNKVIGQYSTTRPAGSKIKAIKSFAGCKAAFANRDVFRTFYNDAIKKVTHNVPFIVGMDDPLEHDPAKDALFNAFHQQNFDADIAHFFTRKLRQEIAEQSLDLKTYQQVDIVHILNMAPIYWIADRFAIPLKTLETPRGLFTPNQLFKMLLVLFVYQSFNVIPAAGFGLAQGAPKIFEALRGVVAARITSANGILDVVQDLVSKGTAYEDSEASEEFYRAFKQTGRTKDQMISDCIGVMAPIAGNLTQQASLLVDFYLRPEYENERLRIVQLASLNTAAADEELMGYIREGMRLSPVVPGLPRKVASDYEFTDGDETLSLKAGDTVLIATSICHKDPVAFPDPHKINPRRDSNSYIHLGHGLHFCFGARLFHSQMLATMKVVFSLKNLRRAPGRPGQLIKTVHHVGEVPINEFLDLTSSEFPAPTTMMVQYDEALVVPNRRKPEDLVAQPEGQFEIGKGVPGEKEKPRRKSSIFNKAPFTRRKSSKLLS